VNHRLFRRTAAVVLGLVTLCLSEAKAAPLLGIAITPSPLTGMAGDDVVLTYSITNLAGAKVTLTDVSVNGPSAIGDVDTLSFEGLFESLLPGEVSAGQLAIFTYAPSMVPSATGVFVFDFGFLLTTGGEPEPGLESAGITVLRGAGVPEPVTLVLLGLGLVTTLSARRRR